MSDFNLSLEKQINHLASKYHLKLPLKELQIQIIHNFCSMLLRDPTMLVFHEADAHKATIVTAKARSCLTDEQLFFPLYLEDVNSIIACHSLALHCSLILQEPSHASASQSLLKAIELARHSDCSPFELRLDALKTIDHIASIHAAAAESVNGCFSVIGHVHSLGSVKLHETLDSLVTTQCMTLLQSSNPTLFENEARIEIAPSINSVQSQVKNEDLAFEQYKAGEQRRIEDYALSCSFLDCELKEHDIGRARAGQLVQVLGIIDRIFFEPPKQQSKRKLGAQEEFRESIEPSFKLILRVLSLRVIATQWTSDQFQSIAMSSVMRKRQAEEDLFRAMIHRRLHTHFPSTLSSQATACLLLTLVGASDVSVPFSRAHLHTLVICDRSQQNLGFRLCSASSTLAPKSIFVQSSSALALFPRLDYMQQPEHGLQNSATVQEAGALAASDGGLLALNKPELLDEHSLLQLTHVMNSGQVSAAIVVAGQAAGQSTVVTSRTWPARFSLIAVTYTKSDAYDESLCLEENISLNKSLLKSFDLVLRIGTMKASNAQEDVQRYQSVASLSSNPIGKPSKRRLCSEADMHRCPVLTSQEMTTLVACLRATVQPQWSQSSWLAVMNAAKGSKLPRRALLTWIRLTSALARLNFTEAITQDHASEALSLMQSCEHVGASAHERAQELELQSEAATIEAFKFTAAKAKSLWAKIKAHCKTDASTSAATAQISAQELNEFIISKGIPASEVEKVTNALSDFFPGSLLRSGPCFTVHCA